ncbi:MAG: hypothetical protein ACOVQT_06900 [Rubrivivax sp.]
MQPLLRAGLAPALTEQRAALQVQRDEQAALLRRIDRLERLLAHSRAALERARQTPTSAYCP